MTRATVPGVAIVVAYLLVFVSIVVLVMYVHHIGQSLRVSALIELVGSDTREAARQRYPDKGSDPARMDVRVVPAPESGVVTRIARPGPRRRCAHSRLHARTRAGARSSSYPAGVPSFAVHGTPRPCAMTRLRAVFALDLERTLDQDAAYGLRLLVDIAERSLSDSPFHDPTTAVQAIDRLHDCLRQLAR